MSTPLMLLREVLDHEIVDRDGVSCGIVDDVALETGADGALRIAGLLVGPGAWAPRLPALLALAAAKLAGSRRVQVPWDQVETIGETIRLRATAAQVGLGTADRRLGQWLARLPRA